MARNAAPPPPTLRKLQEQRPTDLLADDDDDDDEAQADKGKGDAQGDGAAKGKGEQDDGAATGNGSSLTVFSPLSATTALALLKVPPPPSKSLKNRVGTRNAPYRRRDGKLTVKLQAAISVETDRLLMMHAQRLPKHIKFNDFVDMIVRDGIAKFERDLQEAASADLQSRMTAK